MLTQAAKIVPRHSAILLGSTPRSIRADHVNMTKFEGPQDDGYKSVSTVLWRWARQLEEPPAPATPGRSAAAAAATRQSWASPTSGGVYTQGGSTYSGQVNVAGGGHVHQGNVMNTR